MTTTGTDSSGQQDLRTYLRIFWRWKLLFLAIVVLIPLGAYLAERGKPKIYESSTLLEVQNSTVGALPTTSGNLLAVAQLVTTTPIAREAARFLDPPPASPDSLIGEVSASADTNTGFLTITVQDQSPYRAAAIATAFAKAIGGYQTNQSIRAIDLQISALVKELAAISPSDQASQASVTQQIAQLRAERGATGAGAQILEPAAANPRPVGPNPRRAVELAFVIALLLGIGAVLGAEHADRRLRTPEDLENLTNWPLLGVIPGSAFSPNRPASQRDEEAFQILRADLTHFNDDRPVSSVAIISPLVGDGKTTVAVGLAVATAKAGKQAVLVDADLRRPQVSTRLGIPPAAGLADVLTGELELDEVMIEYGVDAPAGGRLLVLPAGSPPSNPAALIGSQQMRSVLRRLEEQADLVIIDTAAALAVSDSVPLLQITSGVVMIVRMNRSSSAAVRRLQKVVASVRGTVLGVVATGTGSTAAGYGDYYYARRDSGGSGRLGGRRSRRSRSRKRADGWSSGRVARRSVASLTMHTVPISADGMADEIDAQTARSSESAPITSRRRGRVAGHEALPTPDGPPAAQREPASIPAETPEDASATTSTPSTQSAPTAVRLLGELLGDVSQPGDLPR